MAALTIVRRPARSSSARHCHARTHTYAIIEASTKRRVACEQFPTTSAGISRALAWAGRRTDGDMACLWAVECIGSYGARQARAVADAGYDVAEAPRMNARGRRAIGKSDAPSWTVWRVRRPNWPNCSGYPGRRCTASSKGASGEDRCGAPC